MPYSIPDSSRVIMAEIANPEPNPINASVRPRLTIMRNTSSLCAPSAMRNPISSLRCTTMYESKPYNPTAERRSASPAKHVNNKVWKRGCATDFET